MNELNEINRLKLESDLQSKQLKVLEAKILTLESLLSTQSKILGSMVRTLTKLLSAPKHKPILKEIKS